MNDHLKNIQSVLIEDQSVKYDESTKIYTVTVKDFDDLKFKEELFDSMLVLHNVDAGEVVLDVMDLRRKYYDR